MSLKRLQLMVGFLMLSVTTMMALPAHSAITFATKTDYAAGAETNSVITGDFNGDGKADLATVDCKFIGKVSILMGNGDGTFDAAVDYGTGASPGTVTTGDFNGDGKTDLATSNGDGLSVSILLGVGDGTFVAAVNYGIGRLPTSVTTGDFDADGKTDLATSNWGGDVSILLGNGDGTFKTAVHYSNGGYNSQDLTTGDFDADGKTDLVIGLNTTTDVLILLGNGDGTFRWGGLHDTLYVVTSVTTGDFNADGKTDLATPGEILLGNGDGTFGTSVQYHIGDYSVSAGDFNADGKADLAGTHYDADTVSILQGNGDGIFGTAINYGTGDTPNTETIGDFNADGYPDLATGNRLAGTVSILINTTPIANDVVTAHAALNTALATYSEGSYTTINWTTLTNFKTAGDAAIDAATNLAGVTSARNTVTTGMAGVLTIAQQLAADKAVLVEDDIKGGNPNLANITVALTSPLPSSGTNGSAITWTSDKPAVVSDDGQTINRPTFTVGDATVTFTATLTIGAESVTKPFALTVLKLPASAIATVTSGTYTVTNVGGGSETIINIPLATAKSTFLAALSKGQVHQNWNDSGIADPVMTGNTLVVTAEDATTIVTYTVTVNLPVITASAGANGAMTPLGQVSVAYDGSQAFTITPDTGYHVADVLVDGSTVGAVGSYTFTNVITNHSVSATFAIDTFTLTSSAGANGSITPSASVNYGTGKTFTITPEPNYHVADVIVDTVSQGAVTIYAFTNVTANHTISATFAIDTFTLTSSAGANGSITPSATVNYGAGKTFTITPDLNYHVADVLVDGSSVGAVTSHMFTNVTANHTIDVSFAFDFTFVDNGADITITGYTGGGGDVTIPDLIIGKPVTSIENSTFAGCTSLTSVIIPDTVTHIGDQAFYGCTALTDLDIPDNVISIGEEAFADCSSLTGVTIGSRVESIGNSAFFGCLGLTGIVIPDSVTSIGIGAFGCTGLTSVAIPGNVTSIGYGVFVGCTGLTTISVSPANSSYSSEAGVLFDEGTIILHSYPLGKVGDYAIPDGVTTIGSYAFYGCTDLTGVIIPGSVTSIELAAFACAGLTDVVIPDGVTSIGESAFSQCLTLVGACFFGDAPVMDDYVFDDCASGFTVYFIEGAGGFTLPTWKGYPSALFTLNIASSAGPNGTISPTPSATVKYGESQTFTVTPDTGYHVADVLVDGSSIGAVTSHAFTNVTAAHTISTTFTINTYTLTYNAGANGSITGTTPQTVDYGSDGSAVIAVPTAGYTFINWSDGVKTASRTDTNVTGDITVTATFLDSALANGLVAWWKAEDNALDSIGNNNGTLSGTAAYAAGREGKAFDLDGNTGCVEKTSPDNSLNIGTQSWSISAWIKTSSASAKSQTIVSRYSGGWSCVPGDDADYELIISASGNAQFYVRGTNGDVNVADNVDIRDGNWHHLTGVLDRNASTAIIAVDGQIRNTAYSVDVGEVNDSGSPLEIGRLFRQVAWGSPDYYFNGQIDEVKIYNRALTPLEIVTLAGSNYVWNASPEGDFIFNPATGAITGYTGPVGPVVIPFTIGGVSVTLIGASAFLNKQNPTSIAIPCSVTSIGNYAFAACTSLTSISIPSSVISIGNGAFEGCTVLPGITIPSSVASIGTDAFNDCRALQSISIPSGITSIKDRQFWGCGSLTSVTIPDSVTSIGESAFSTCKKLPGITIPSGVTSIGDSAFAGCEKLNNVSIPSGVTTIGIGIFNGCKELDNISFSGNVTSIGAWAFYGIALTTMTIPDSVTSIGESALAGCASLYQIIVDSDNQNYASEDGVLFNKDRTTIVQYPAGKGGAYTIPSTVTTIGSWTFAGLTSLTDIRIPGGIISIGDSAFKDCTSLASAYFYGNAPATFGSNVFAGVASTFTIYYDSSPETDFTTPNWKTYPCKPTVPLENGTPISGISGLSKLVRIYKINVQTGQTLLEIRTSGASGDCDIEVIAPSGATAKQAKGTTCNEFIQIKNPTLGIWLIYLSGVTDYSGVTLTAKYSKQTVAPAVPSSVNASDGLFDDRIVVTWKAVPGATSYVVGRKNQKTDAAFADEFETTDTVFEDTSQSVTDEPGTLFYYFIKAKNTFDQGKYSAGNSGYVANKPSTVATPTASDGTYFDKIRVSWKKVTGATSYLIFRTDAATTKPVLGTDTPIGETTALFYDDFGSAVLVPRNLDETVKRYYYWIAAKNQNGNTAIGKYNDGYLSKKGPATITASNGTYLNRIIVTWAAVSGATTYDVYRYTDTKFTQLDNTFGTVGVVSAGAVLEYEDASAAVDTLYYYKVKAKYGVKYYSDFSLTGAIGKRATGKLAPVVTAAISNGGTTTNTGVKTKDSSLYYSFEVPIGTARLVAVLNGVPPTVGTVNDCDLFAKFANFPTKASYGAKSVENLVSKTEILTVSNPAAGTWYFLLYGTMAYSNVTLTVTCYSVTDIVLTAVPANDLPVPFTAAFKGKVVDEIGTGIPGLVLQVRNPITGLTSSLTTKTDAKGFFSYSVLINSEGEHTFDFFFSTMPDIAKGTASHTVATRKGCLVEAPNNFFDFSTYLPANPVTISSQDDVIGLQNFLDTRNGWDEDDIDDDYETMWINSTIVKTGSDSKLLGKLDEGLYLFFYGVEGAGVGNDTDKTPKSAFSAMPFVVHVASGQRDTVISNMLTKSIINASQKIAIESGKIGIIAIASIDSPDDGVVPDNISLLAAEQLELLAKFAAGSQDVPVVDGGTYTDVPTMKSAFTLNDGARKINVLSAVFVK